jgi:hypothetical protein
LTTQPGPHARPSSLHPRLTVALGSEADRARVVDALPAVAIHSGDLWDAADVLAAERSGDRAAARSRLDAIAARALHDVETGRSQLEHLGASRTALLEGADWALDLDEHLADLHADVDAARVALEGRQAEQRSARQALERVLEQRAAAAAAIEEADQELGELVGVGMDETGLRRELEASGQAVRSAQAAHGAAGARVQDLLRERDALDAELAELQGAPGAAAGGFVDPLLVDRVREQLTTWLDQAELGGPDPQARLLAEAWADLNADLAEQAAHSAPSPTEVELAAAEARVVVAAQELDRHSAPAPTMDPAARAALAAAHDTVLAAEERTGRRVGAGAAEKRLAEARAAERALLDRYGFDSYIDVVLTGGRRPTGSAERLAAEQAYVLATTERDALLAALQVSPELEYLDSEGARLLALTADLLGVDPGDNAIELLHAHPLLPRSIVEGLRDALATVGLHPVGAGLAEVAAQWVDHQDAAAAERDRRREVSGNVAVRMAAVTARQVDLVDDLAAAEHAEANAAEQLELALRSVGAFEAELSVRVGEDEQRLQRFAAAEQLRSQVEALSATLVRAEAEARDGLDRAGVDVADAEVGIDRLTATVTDHTRRARRLANELPIDQRPEGDPLATLPLLAERLRSHAGVLEPEISAAEAALAKATEQLDAAVAVAQATSTGLEGPLAEDLCDALAHIFESNPDQLIVLDDPFVGIDDQVRYDLLVLVLERSTTSPLVFLTEDTDLLGWAIELPAKVASALPVDALLTNALMNSADRADLITDPTPAPARRWAGRR